VFVLFVVIDHARDFKIPATPGRPLPRRAESGIAALALATARQNCNPVTKTAYQSRDFAVDTDGLPAAS